MSETRSISLPEELCAKAVQKFGTRFGELDEFVTTVIIELLRDEAAVLDKREERVIEERLKGLGYI